MTGQDPQVLGTAVASEETGDCSVEALRLRTLRTSEIHPKRNAPASTTTEKDGGKEVMQHSLSPMRRFPQHRGAAHIQLRFLFAEVQHI